MPGAHLCKFADVVFSRKMNTKVLQPMLAELQHEYTEALKEKNFGKARWIRVRGVVHFWSHVAGVCIVTPIKAIRKIWTLTGGGG